MPAILEHERLPDAQLADGERHVDVAGVGLPTESSRELHCGSEQIVVVVGEWLARTDADADVQRHLGLGVEDIELLLHRDRKGDRRRDGRERSHDAVAGVLHLAAAMVFQLGTHDLVVPAQELEMSVVAERVGLRDRTADVGEHDGAQRRRGVRRAVGCAGNVPSIAFSGAVGSSSTITDASAPCASRCTVSTASLFGPSARQNTVPAFGSNQ